MYSVSEAFQRQINADNREFSIKLVFTKPTARELTGTTIQSITVDEVVNSTDALTLGCACSNKITVNLIKPPTDMAYENAVFTAYVGLKIDADYEYVPLGKFYVTNVESNNDFESATITAYDGFSQLNEKYLPALEKTTTIFDKTITLWNVYSDLLWQIEEKCDIHPSYIYEKVEMPQEEFSLPFLDITYHQALGYVAGCIGCFVRFDREGYIELVPYTDTGYVIARDVQYLNGFKKTTKNSLCVTSLTTGTQDNAIVCGDGANGTVISFENPYITQNMADAVFEMYNGLEYTPCNIKWRGNPAIQAGDMVKAVDKDGNDLNVLVMSQSIKIGGGLNCTIDCKGKGETTSNFSTNFEPIGQKVDRVCKSLEQQILDSTNAITGNNGGYVVFRDSNGDNKPDEILVMDTDDVSTAVSVWRWNKEGLGYSDNGYRGPYRTAITANGHIVADFITIGSLRADLVTLEDENGNFIKLKDGIIRFNDSLKLGKIDGVYQLAFYNTNGNRIAYFSDNSFEIDLEYGKVRFGNFGYILRKNGNLSFGKLI